jgi:hypothetical protein
LPRRPPPRSDVFFGSALPARRRAICVQSAPILGRRDSRTTPPSC